MNRVHGWFSDNKAWIEFVIATVVLYLLTMVAIHELIGTLIACLKRDR